MSRLLKSMLAGLLAAAMAFSAAAAPNLSFGAVVDHLDLRKNTKLHVREYRKSIQDQQVSWSGEVFDVQLQ